MYWLHAPSLESIGQSKLKLLSGHWISIFSNSNLDLNHRHLGSNPKPPLDTHTASLVSIGQSKLKLLSGNLSLTPFRIRPKPTARPNARPPARSPFTNLITRIFVENLVKIDLLAEISLVDWYTFQLPKVASNRDHPDEPYVLHVRDPIRLKPWSSCLEQGLCR